MRPIYRIRVYAVNEERLRAKVEGACYCKLYKVGMKYGADYFGFRANRAVSLVEMKNRTCESTTYDTYMISLAKVKKCLEYGELLGVPFVVVVEWTDRTGYVTIDRSMVRKDTVRMQLQNFRGDKQDIEPCLHIGIDLFKPLGEKE